MKTLHDGTEVADDVPTRATPLGRFRLTAAESAARREEEAAAAVEAPAAEAALLRSERDRRLAASDWTQLADAPLTDGQKATWAVYRQALRDLDVAALADGRAAWPDPPSGKPSD